MAWQIKECAVNSHLEFSNTAASVVSCGE